MSEISISNVTVVHEQLHFNEQQWKQFREENPDNVLLREMTPVFAENGTFTLYSEERWVEDMNDEDIAVIITFFNEHDTAFTLTYDIHNEEDESWRYRLTNEGAQFARGEIVYRDFRPVSL